MLNLPHHFINAASAPIFNFGKISLPTKLPKKGVVINAGWRSWYIVFSSHPILAQFSAFFSSFHKRAAFFQSAVASQCFLSFAVAAS